MSSTRRMRWLAYEDWVRTPSSMVARGALAVAEILVTAPLMWAYRDRWWAGFLVFAALACDYIVLSIAAYRSEGPVERPRMALHRVSLDEWRARCKRRWGLIALASLELVAVGSTGGRSELLLLVPLLWAADYLWCCASAGGWLASRPPPPSPAT